MKITLAYVENQMNRDIHVASYNNYESWLPVKSRCVCLTYNPATKLHKLFRNDVGLVAEAERVDGLVAAYNALVDWVDEK